MAISGQGITQQTKPQAGTAIAGYFANGNEAHRAINALIDEGFLPSEIGAAFHSDAASEQFAGSEGTADRQPNVGGSLREELGTTIPRISSHETATGRGGASSDTLAVQYASLGGGAGTPFDGASRPGPISGSSLVNTGLPTELKSELPHDGEIQGGQGVTGSGSTTAESSERRHLPFTAASTESTSGPLSQASGRETLHEHQHESWTDKLKHVFGSGHTHTTHQKNTDTLRAEVAKDSMDFGTGEGDLGLNRINRTRYSQPAFEKSFSGYGVQPEHARHLSHRIGHGGAIVTVHAAARAADAERVLQAHGGEVRFEGTGSQQPASSQSAHQAGGGGEVEVFGTVGRDYPGYFD
jgi:hypothetical protein